MQRRHALLAVSVAVIALTIAIVAAPATVLAATPGSGSWFWPVGTEDFHGWDGWWVYRSANHSWHMAQDMPSPTGHDVFAIGDGIVLESNPDAQYGGVLVILHKAADGREFKAVYGHIRRGDFPKGSKVRAGQVIGHVNGDRHVHFGIHPGRAYPPDGNPYRGHTYVRSNTYGWTDPLGYLRANPRVLKYAAPLLPTVATVETLLVPTVLGTTDGTVFWSTETSDDVVTRHSRPIAGDATETVTLDAGPPSLDTTRFLATVSGTSFTLADRLPVLAAAYSSRTPRWGTATTISGTLRNAAGSPFVGATVTLERSVDATSWTRIGNTLTGLKGAWSISYRPVRAYRVRLRFSPPVPYVTATSAETTVAPHAGVSAPDEHACAGSGHSFEVAGTLRPRHPAGSRTVIVRFQRYEAGTWAEASTHLTTNRHSGSATRYYHRVSLAAGRWRVRAETAADSLHAATTSGWFAIAVR
jgi:murein DD-endopeptidase MepM/ murein hydrolase activator NlpD